ncbi:hypothetical protein PQE66_gp229 [Bacillus phage PBC2]|uniref:DUF2828 family protein n=1 Tax=Bacillus phage PBC2 TaxID=1675029 RepID=A0A218KCC5_9CAUD|nr:hypothetical protein PQE66_gp229 [Bacillus phage PBC2]AKQ08544.1 hypothetical protein PBC2_229 [Bacillus phage PBC2]
MLDYLKDEFNESNTTNGAFAYKSTKSDVLDLFATGGAFRNRSDEDVKGLVSKAYAENPELALKALFYLRDITEGQGERRFFRVAMQHLALHHKESLKKNLALVPAFGRWDDLWVLLETSLKADVLAIVKRQLKADKQAEHPSLLAKWMPSENASSYKTKKYAKIMREHFGVKPKQYRKLLSALRAKLNLVETKLTDGRYGEIQYDKLPSRAGMIYRGAFFKHDEDRYKSFLDSLSKGEVKVNAKALYPNDIVGKILDATYGYGWNRRSISEQDIQLFDGQWKNLPDFIGDNAEEALVMADVSGSMYGNPMNVAISLAMYIAERNKSKVYKDNFMTFSSSPELVQIKGGNIVEKVSNISKADWGMSTNIESALHKILDVAVKNGLSNDEVVKKLYIISDMQFNQCVKGADVHIFKNMEKEFNRHGYTFPNIVFWNVNAYNNSPMLMNDVGVQLVSGFSPSILTQLLNANGKTPYDFMLDVILGDRYKEVTA